MPPSHVEALSKIALLCIDDDQDVLECEKAFLEDFGYTVVTASSGREGLELAAFQWFDIVIVDYCMPEMNGQEFAIAMRRLRPRAPIIMLSGTVDIPGQALKVVDAFVAKDCLASRLLPVIVRLREEYSVQGSGPIKGLLGHDLAPPKTGFISSDVDS